MMDFSPRRRNSNRENIVPMINVVFLLLIFFLMTAQIAPPEPFALTPPDAQGGQAAPLGDTLYIAVDGRLAYEEARGDAVFAAIAIRADTDSALHIRADAGLPGAELARILPRLVAVGVHQTVLLTGLK